MVLPHIRCEGIIISITHAGAMIYYWCLACHPVPMPMHTVVSLTNWADTFSISLRVCMRIGEESLN